MAIGLYSCVGFGAGFLGTLLFGITLDQFGGTSQLAAWVLSFGTCGHACLAGAAATAFLPGTFGDCDRRSMPVDHNAKFGSCPVWSVAEQSARSRISARFCRTKVISSPVRSHSFLMRRLSRVEAVRRNSTDYPKHCEVRTESEMKLKFRALVVTGALLGALFAAAPAWAEKYRGILKLYTLDSPASMSILDERRSSPSGR
jgi:hypothetical protein